MLTKPDNWQEIDCYLLNEYEELKADNRVGWISNEGTGNFIRPMYQLIDDLDHPYYRQMETEERTTVRDLVTQ